MKLKKIDDEGRRIKSHIAICGTGRAGTTLLVKILHRAGLDTGFSEDQLRETERDISRAGLEKTPSVGNANFLPDIIKSPGLYKTASKGLAEGWLNIDLIIIPVRDIDEVLRSRSFVTYRTFYKHFTKGGLRGGFVGGMKMLFRQREAILDMFFQNVSIAVKYDIPIVFLDFPRFATDKDYLVSSLYPILSQKRQVDRESLISAHEIECRPELVRGQ